MESIKVYKVVCVGSSKGLLVKYRDVRIFFEVRKVKEFHKSPGKFLTKSVENQGLNHMFRLTQG